MIPAGLTRARQMSTVLKRMVDPSVLENVVWGNLTNVEILNTNDVNATASNGFARSTKGITRGTGYVEWKVRQSGKNTLMGLTSQPNNDHASSPGTEMEWCIYTWGPGEYWAQYNGTTVKTALGTVTTGHTLRLSAEGGAMKFYINGVLTYTFNQADFTAAGLGTMPAISYPLYPDTFMAESGGGFNEAKLYGVLA